MAHRNRERKPARKKAGPSKRRILVLCEGKCTEPQYIRGFARHFRRNMVDVVIPDKKHGDPSYLVEECKKELTENAREVHRLRDPSLRFDEAWCVFDRDDHAHFQKAIAVAAASKINIAPSKPSFELWLYLHFRDPPGQCTQAEIARKLRTCVEDYEKHVDFELYLGGYQSATKRADRTISESTGSGKGPHGNPTTHVQSLTRAILGPDFTPR